MKFLNVLGIFFTAGLLLLGIGPARATTNDAASGSFADVSAAVALSQPGDTVLIPPGRKIWTSTLQISGITLRGSGTNTIIVDETPPVGNGTPLIQMNTAATMTRVTQLQFLLGVTNTFPYQNYNGSILVCGSSPLFRVDHCLFSWLTSKPIHVSGGEYGLIDHCVFMMTNSANAVEVDDSGYGDTSWQTPYVTGTSNAVYMEDNYIYSANSFCAVDISVGGRAVFRHNTLVGSFFNTHGLETSQRYRSARYVEVYNNNFSWGGGKQYNNFYTTCDLRGGSAVVFSNTAVGFWSIGSINYYRATDNDTGFLPWYGATGQSGWDSNGPALLNGNASVASNVLVVAGASWTSNQWVGCTVLNLSNPNSTSQLCGIVTASTSNTMSFLASRSAWLQITFKVGDPFVVHKIYPMLDQPGMGTATVLSGGNPTPAWLNEVPDPIYVWGNSLSLMYNVATVAPPNAGSLYPNIQQNRDYFNGVAKPGYVAFTYPHPLVLLDGSTNALGIPPLTNSAASPLTPPTDLNAQGL